MWPSLPTRPGCIAAGLQLHGPNTCSTHRRPSPPSLCAPMTSMWEPIWYPMIDWCYVQLPYAKFPLQTWHSWHWCLQSCVIPNFGSASSNIKNCFIVANSLSDTLTKNVIQLQGMAFPNEICLLIANNAVKSVAVSVQMFQYYDCKLPANLWISA